MLQKASAKLFKDIQEISINEIEEQQVKAVYTIEQSPDKKTAVNNNVMYEVFRQYLLDSNNKLNSNLRLVAYCRV